jgi:hypothetical protein
MATKNDSSPARQLFVDFLEDFLQISFVGFQSGFDMQPDLILFEGPCGSTLAVPASVMHEPRETARRIIQEKIAASDAAFNRALDVEMLEAVDRYWNASSRSVRAVNQTNIGREIANRAVELRDGLEAA